MLHFIYATSILSLVKANAQVCILTEGKTKVILLIILFSCLSLHVFGTEVNQK